MADNRRQIDTDDESRRHNVNETNDKIRIETKIKRGTATRDQDTHKIKVRGETPAKAANNLDSVIQLLESRDVFERVRQLQTDTDDNND